MNNDLFCKLMNIQTMSESRETLAKQDLALGGGNPLHMAIYDAVSALDDKIYDYKEAAKSEIEEAISLDVANALYTIEHDFLKGYGTETAAKLGEPSENLIGLVCEDLAEHIIKTIEATNKEDD